MKTPHVSVHQRSGERINKLLAIHPVERSSAIKGKPALTQGTT